MKKFMLVATTMVSLYPMTSFADAPACTRHLQEPGTSGRLTQEQIDANNACLNVVTTQKKIAEELAAISESERKSKGVTSFPGQPMHSEQSAPPSPFFVQQQSSSMGQRPMNMPGASVRPAPEKSVDDQPLASVDAVLWEGGNVLTALLRLPDGQSFEAMKGTILPDGSVVTVITPTGSVIISRQGKKTSLPTSGTPQQATSYGNAL